MFDFSLDITGFYGVLRGFISFRASFIGFLRVNAGFHRCQLISGIDF